MDKQIVVYKTADDGSRTEIPVYESAECMVAFRAEGESVYECVYEDTPLRSACKKISFITLIFLI